MKGFLKHLILKHQILLLIPTPAPINPVVAKPVPIIFAACIILNVNCCIEQSSSIKYPKNELNVYDLISES